MTLRTPLLVGMVLILATGALTYFVMNTNKDKFDEDNTYVLLADFKDASGLRAKTRVQINGIDVGKIGKIEHVRGPDKRLVARVTLRIANEYEIYDDADVKKSAESLLGDFRIDLDPGTPDGHRKLSPGEVIPNVRTKSDIDEIKDQLLQVSKNVNDVSKSFSKVLSGPEGEGSLKSILSKVEESMTNIQATTSALEHTIVGNDRVLSEIIQNVGKVSDALATVSQPGGDMRTVAHNLAQLSNKLDRMADNVNGLIAGSKLNGPDQQQPGNLQSTLDNLNETLANLNDITRKIDEGQGTVGRVINDPGIADRVEATLDSANEIIGSIAGLETMIELRSEYDIPISGSTSQLTPSIKNTLSLRIFPKPDKFYIIEAVADPRGLQTRRLTTATVGNTTITTDETVTDFSDLKFSAMFAKRYYFLTLRFGIIENTGGLGMDFHALNDTAEVRLDAYDFDRRDPTNTRPIFPRLKVTGIYELARHVHVQLGIDDPFNTGLNAWFAGGVLRFTDEDLKAMLAIAPKP